jgi:hypothetical protein
MIPLEAIGHICLVVTAKDDASPHWSLGAVRVTPGWLNSGANRDKKSTLNPLGKAAIRWIFRQKSLPPNVLQQLPGPDVDAIMAPVSGQKRVNELFRRTLQMRVGRAVIATVAQQEDYMKRVRENGGARTHLKKEGIIVLGDYTTHREIAHKLGLPTLERGEFVSARLVPASRREANSAEIDGQFWRLAAVGDPVVRAPKLPDVRASRASAD